MSKYALLIIDMLNEYLTPKGLVYCENCRSIIPSIKKNADFARANGVLVVYVNTSLTDDRDILAKKWGLHAVEGTFGSQVINELFPHKDDLIIKKKLYNGFAETTLDHELRAHGVTNTVITGIHTHVCVLLTAVGAFEKGYEVTTLEDCITTGYLPNHETRLRFFKTHTGELVNSEEWMKKVSNRG